MIKENRKYIIIASIFIVIALVLIIILIPKKEKEVDNPVEEVTISFVDEYVSLIVGEEYELEIECTSQNKENILFSSTNPDIISVDDKGIIKALKEGESIVSATLDNSKAEIKVTSEIVNVDEEIPYIEVEEIKILDNQINLKSGKTYTITTKVLPENATNPKVIWETNDTRVATVTDDGLVMARTSGTTTLTAYSLNGKSASIEVNVESPTINLSSILFSPNSLSLEKGDTYQTRISFIPANANIGKVTYSSTNSSIVRVSNSGLIEAVAAGSATITASVNGKSASIEVTVIAKNTLVDVYSVKLNKDNLKLKKGETDKLIATIMPNNATNKNLIWSSSNTSVVTVNNNGEIKAISKGKAVITATSTNDKKAFVNIEVIEDSTSSSTPKPTELVLSISSVKLKDKETKQVTALVLPMTASQEVEWVSGSPAIATVSSSGIITGIKSGTTTISAITKNGLVAKVNVTVVAHEQYTDKNNNLCLTPYTCFKQGSYGGSFCSTANCGPIATSGCSVTSWATILSMFVTDANGDVYDPLRLTNEIVYGQKLCSRYCSGDTAARKVFTYFGLKTSETYKTKNASDRMKMIEHLKEGNPVLIRVGAGCYTKTGHIMAILAINENNEVWLYDPAKNRPGRNTWVSLSEIVSCSGSSSWFMLVGPKI